MAIRVLQFLDNMNYTGEDAVIMNYYRHIDRSKIQFDFITRLNCAKELEKEIESLGGKVYILPSQKKNPFQYSREYNRIVRNYEIVHINKASARAAIDALRARLLGVKCVIGHSHNTRCASLWAHCLCKPLLRMAATDQFACSKQAGEWLFGKSKSVKIINNAIESEKFLFKQEIREQYRNELGLSEKFVIGFVGRLTEQKNPERLVEIFCKVSAKTKNAVLLIIGEGEQREVLTKMAQENQLDVRFLGNRDDVNKLMMAMDVFVFPSLWEGLGIVTVEAQATGLALVTSDRWEYPVFNNNVAKIPLEKSDEEWSRIITGIKSENREEQNIKLKQIGYDISIEAKKLESFYLERNKAIHKIITL